MEEGAPVDEKVVYVEKKKEEAKKVVIDPVEVEMFKKVDE